MKSLTAVVGVLVVAGMAGSSLAQDNPCTAGGKVYESGKMVCMRGFVQRCENGNWINQQRFCSEDTEFEIIREPDVAVPGVGGGNQPAVPPVVPPADKPAPVEVPPVE
ncbi:MAG TPA: hypothetical protein VMW56_12965 [Candidatus Margulisiibacteriota bacterium]|nr:hypothetical protein [Candidatus Margulisiibacteriota bacterium]